MTTADPTTLDPTSAGPAAPEPPDDGPVGGLIEDPEDQRRRRRKKVLVILLAILFGLFVIFGTWYLINRKPISELPLPGIGDDAMPHFSFAFYGVDKPMGIAVTADGSRIYVTQTGKAREVAIFDGQGTRVGTITPPASEATGHLPAYVAIAPKTGDVWVTDRLAGAIYVYSADGIYRRTFDPGAALVGWQPLGIGFDGDGNVYVANLSSPFHRIEMFSADGTLLKTFGAAGQLNFPNAIAVDGTGKVVVTDSNNGRVVVFGQDGRLISTVPRGAAAGELSLPRGAAIDDSGRIYVVDAVGQGVQVYRQPGPTDRTLKYVGGFGKEGTVDGAFEFPNGIATDTRARVYVADWNNDRVQVWGY